MSVMFEGTGNEFVPQESVFTRPGVGREHKHVTSATKANAMAVSMP